MPYSSTFDRCISEVACNMKHQVLEKLENGEVALGIGLMYPNPSCIESMGKGWDWVWIDGQHGQHDYMTNLHSVQIAELAGLASITRVPGNNSECIGRVLDTGTQGIMVPLVNTPEQARASVDAAKFPPLGQRSYGGRRVIDRDSRSYCRLANEHVLLVVQIETVEAISKARDIAQVEGVDALFFGPDDMKMRMGIPIDTPIEESGQLLEAMGEMAQAALSAGKIAGCIAPTASPLKRATQLGYQLIVGGTDVGFLRNGSATKCEELRAALRSARPCGVQAFSSTTCAR